MEKQAFSGSALGLLWIVVGQFQNYLSSMFSSWETILQHKEILRFVHGLSEDRNMVRHLISDTITTMPFFYTDKYVNRVDA